jgi:SAM-dependent methyltransferase
LRYQETWIKGCPTGEAFQRECASRYEPIKAVLGEYKRPFSVFDFGANMGYFTFRIAEDFPQATVIAVDNRTELPELARVNGLNNVIVIPKRMDGGDLERLARCEAFDVVLALNVLHHMPDWRRAFKAFAGLAHKVIVETPGEGDAGALKRGDHGAIRSSVSAAGDEIHRSKAHTTKGAERIMYRIAGSAQKQLRAQTLDADKRGAPAMGEVVVTRDDDEARISFASREEREFVTGMNAWNAHLLGAKWPADIKARIRREVERLDQAGQWHDDLRPWNFVLSGDRAVAIDIGNKAWRKEPEQGGLDKCLAMLD